MSRFRIQKDLEQSFLQGSLIVTDSNKEPYYLAPANAGDVLTLSNAANPVPIWQAPSEDWHVVGNAISAGYFIGTTNNQDFIAKRNNIEGFRLTTGGALLCTGNSSSGVTPLSGAGSRMMWIPSKAAFRAGNAVSNEWNDANIGQYSAAFGQNLLAIGSYSFLTGVGNVGSGDFCFVAGNGHNVSAIGGFAAGTNNIVGGSCAFAVGQDNTSNGEWSMTIGKNSKSNASRSISIGNDIVNGGVTAICIGTSINMTKNYGVTITDGYSAVNTDNTLDAQFRSRFLGGYIFDLSATKNAMIIADNGKVQVSDLASPTQIIPNAQDNRIVLVDNTGVLYNGVTENRFSQTGQRLNIANTTSPINIIGPGIGSTSIPTVKAGDTVRIRTRGSISTAASGSTGIVNITVTFSGSTVGTFGPIVIPVYGNGIPYMMEIELSVINNSTMSTAGSLTFQQSTTVGSTYQTSTFFTANPALSFGNNTSNPINITATFNAVNANHAFSTSHTTIELNRVYS